MGSEAVQTAIVALVVLAAVAVIVRRVFGFARRDARPACANCASGGPAEGPSHAPAPAPPARPLTFVRSPRR